MFDPQTKGTCCVPVRRSPLVPVALALAGGVVAGRYLPLPVGFWAFVGLAALVTAGAAFRRKHLHLATSAALVAVIIAIGAASFHLNYFSVDENHVVGYSGPRPILATLQGQLVTSPQVLDEPNSDLLGYHRPVRTTFLLKAKTIRTDTGWRKTAGLIRVTVEELDYRLKAGQKVELIGRLGRFRPPANPGQYNWASAARRDGIYNYLTVPGADGVVILAGANHSFIARVFWRLRAAARQHLTACGDIEAGQMLNALIIGERAPALRRLSRIMTRAGVAHFLSISGLHLGIMLGFVYLLCRLMALTPRRAATFVLVILVVYIILAEPRAPLLRSAIMAASLCAAVMLRRRYATLNALAAAAIVLLAIDPLQLFAPGFQLSFVIVTGIVLFYETVRRRIFARWLRRRGLMVFRGEQRLKRWFYYSAGNWVTGGVSMALTAYIAAAPLVAYHFGLFSPYAPLLSLILLPLVVAVLIPGYISMALAWPMPNLSHAIGEVAGSSANALAGAVAALNHLPGISFQLRPVGPVWVLLCYCAILATMVRKQLPFGKSIAAGSIAVFLAITVYSQLPAKPPAVAELNILAVGAGQCAILRTPEGKTYILDAGTRSGFDAYRRALAPFVRSRRLPDPKVAFISHANTDHYNALPPLVRHHSLRRVYLNDYFARVGDVEPAVASLANTLAEHEVEIIRLRAGDEIRLGDRTRVQVLWPPEEIRRELSLNDTSLVLRIECDSRSVLLPADLDSEGLSALAADPQAVRSDVLLMPHHGGWDIKLPEFFEAVSPGFVIVSAGREPTAPASASDEARRFYSRARTSYRYFSTPRNGWILIRFGLGGIDIETMR